VGTGRDAGGAAVIASRNKRVARRHRHPERYSAKDLGARVAPASKSRSFAALRMTVLCTALITLPITTRSFALQTELATRLALPEGPLKLKVVGVSGDVGLINPGKEDILDAKVDMVLDEGVEVIVGQRSAIQLDVGSGQIITFRRMTSAV